MKELEEVLIRIQDQILQAESIMEKHDLYSYEEELGEAFDTITRIRKHIKHRQERNAPLDQ